MTTMPRLQLMVVTSGLRGVEAGLMLALEHIRQLLAWAEHILSGGDPNEQRRTHWLTREDVKARYQGKSK